MRERSSFPNGSLCGRDENRRKTADPGRKRSGIAARGSRTLQNESVREGYGRRRSKGPFWLGPQARFRRMQPKNELCEMAGEGGEKSGDGLRGGGDIENAAGCSWKNTSDFVRMYFYSCCLASLPLALLP
ncbi:hypothetical protein MTO96_020092 [Rhipicephalus appendiculatus]